MTLDKAAYAILNVVESLMVAIIHIGVGSDVVCSSGLGNARALGSGTDNRRFHAFLCCYHI